MDPVAIFMLIMVILLAAIFVAQPFLEHQHIKSQSSPEVSSLLAEREKTLNALLELDFDNGLGKIPEEEYSAQRSRLIKTGSDILKRLVEIEGTQHNPTVLPDGSAVLHEDSQVINGQLEDLISKRRAARRHKTAGFCPHCGKPIQQSDLFCPSCGVNLQ